MELDLEDVIIQTFPTRRSRLPIPEIGVRLYHKPTGLEVEFKESCSVHRNKAEAIKLLKRLLKNPTSRKQNTL